MPCMYLWEGKTPTWKEKTPTLPVDQMALDYFSGMVVHVDGALRVNFGRFFQS